MKEIDHKRFKELIQEIPSTTLEDVSILLPDDYFDCRLSRTISLKPIMFLGLNRSRPDIYSLPYHNMKNAILEFLSRPEDRDIRGCFQGSYLSDFIKYPILKKISKNQKFPNAGEVWKLVKDNPEILKECGEILKKEIEVFGIRTVFCFGGHTYALVSKYFGKNNSKIFSIKLNNQLADFIKLDHYSKANQQYYYRIKELLRQYCCRKK